jgi:phage terminase large subunit
VTPIRVALLASLLTATTKAAKLTWPSPRYREDPEGFAWDIFGVRLHPDQVDIIWSVVKSRRTTCVACHKAGKTMLGAIAALWWYCCIPGARAVLFAPTDDNIQSNLYYEIEGLIRRSGCCGDCRQAFASAHPHPEYIREEEYPRPCPHSGTIDEQPLTNASDGIQAPDGRQIFGVAASNPVALQGLSGRILIIADEAPGIRDEHMTALKSSLAAEHTRFLMIGNANFATGTFFDSFHRNAANYARFEISAFKIVEYVEAGIIPAAAAFASRVWISEVLAECQGDEDHPEYRLRVLARFPRQDDKNLIARGMVEDSGLRWLTRKKDAEGRPIGEFARDAGRLEIGVDVAGEGPDADDIGIAAVRGLVCLEMYIVNGLDKFAIADEVARIADRYRDHSISERANIKVDAAGIGHDTYREIQRTKARQDQVYAVRPGDPPPRRSDEYLFIRDEIWFTVRNWIRSGGDAPNDAMLQEELFTVTYGSPYSPKHAHKRTIERKDVMRKRLKRSPDRADALGLAVWDPDGGHEHTWARIVAPEGRPLPAPPRPRVTPQATRGGRTTGNTIAQWMGQRRG